VDPSGLLIKFIGGSKLFTRLERLLEAGSGGLNVSIDPQTGLLSVSGPALTPLGKFLVKNANSKNDLARFFLQDGVDTTCFGAAAKSNESLHKLDIADFEKLLAEEGGEPYAMGLLYHEIFEGTGIASFKGDPSTLSVPDNLDRAALSRDGMVTAAHYHGKAIQRENDFHKTFGRATERTGSQFGRGYRKLLYNDATITYYKSGTVELQFNK
jgi:hypothetical protein